MFKGRECYQNRAEPNLNAGSAEETNPRCQNEKERTEGLRSIQINTPEPGTEDLQPLHEPRFTTRTTDRFQFWSFKVLILMEEAASHGGT